MCKTGIDVDEPKSTRYGYIAIALFLMPVMYTLSLGPAILVYEMTDYSQFKTFIEWFYTPLEYCYNEYSWATTFFDWYLSIWVPNR